MARYTITLEMDDATTTVDEIIESAKQVIMAAEDFTWHVAELDDDGDVIGSHTLDLTAE